MIILYTQLLILKIVTFLRLKLSLDYVKIQNFKSVIL